MPFVTPSSDPTDSQALADIKTDVDRIPADPSRENGNLGDISSNTQVVSDAVSGDGIPVAGALIQEKFDTILDSWNAGTFTETFTYKLSGATVATVTVVFTDATKSQLVSVVKS